MFSCIILNVILNEGMTDHWDFASGTCVFLNYPFLLNILFLCISAIIINIIMNIFGYKEVFMFWIMSLV